MRRMLDVTLLGALVLTACGGGAAEGESPSSVATVTTEAATTSAGVSDKQLAAAAAIGDPAAGEEFFSLPLAEMRDSVSCSSCHLVDGPDTQWGPTIAGISAVAADRVAEMSDVDYLRQSIVDPYAFVVAGDWAFAMPYEYPDILSDEQINNLIAFLMTR